MRRILKALPVALATVALLAAFAVPAGAVKPAKLLGSGSDTTYFLMQDLDALYNGSVGCVVIGSPQVLNFNCYPDGPDTIHTENYAHDQVSEAYPLGSSVGITQLATQGNSGVTTIAYARSSRGPRVGDNTGLRFVAYARDAISWWTHNTNTHAPANLTQAQIQGVWNTCTNTQWGDINGNGGDTTAIKVYAAQNGSGTRATFDGFLGTGANSTNCIPAQFKDGDPDNGERVIFENDAQPILDAGDEGTAIFYYSFGRFDQNGGQGGSLGKVDNVAPTVTTIQNGTFPYGRFLYNVYRATTNTLKAKTQTKNYIGEKIGWLCKPAASHGTNPFTGHNYRTDIENTISAEGFVPLPLGLVGGGISGSSHCRVTPVPV